MKKTATTVLMLAVTLAASNAMACGEVVNSMGGALHYHAFVTRHPAQILLYDGTAAREAPKSDMRQFDEELAKAGHHVKMVDSPDALAKALASKKYDVVISYAGDLSAIKSQLASISHEPALIPVFQRSDMDAARKQYPLAMNDDANLNQFLKTIEQTMKSRGT
ncbi:MAG: hypothetical protein JSR27_07975 [Proteobacteria bacterium]|nr:hypothetical protein [Pseudomonadota bacterium]